MNDELKPCPFCGEKAEVYHAFIPWAGNYKWVVGCDGDLGSLCPGYAWKLTPAFLTSENAIAMWNRRAKE